MNDSSSSFLFSSQPLSFREKRKRDSLPKKTDSKRSRSSETSTKGWLVALGPYTFPSSWSVNPCKNFAKEGKSCAFGRSCDFEHKLYPKGYTRKVQAQICKWVRKTQTIKFANFVRDSDRNITFGPCASTSNSKQQELAYNSSAQSGMNTDSKEISTPASNGTSSSSTK